MEVGEAVIWEAPLSESQREQAVEVREGEAVGQLPLEGLSRWGALGQDERSRLNLDRAERRARTAIRRYGVRNQLDHLVTLTYRCTACDGDPCSCGLKADRARDLVKRDVNPAMRAARDLGDGEAFPYQYVVERGKRSTKRNHVHVAVRGEDVARVEAAWTWGRVDVKPPPKNGQGKRARARGTAGYLAKYVSKELYSEDGPNLHAYERSQGFNLRVSKRQALARWSADWFVRQRLGVGEDQGVEVADSEDWEDWFGPPMMVYRLV